MGMIVKDCEEHCPACLVWLACLRIQVCALLRLLVQEQAKGKEEVFLALVDFEGFVAGWGDCESESKSPSPSTSSRGFSIVARLKDGRGSSCGRIKSGE